MTTLVTGATGFVGWHVARLLVERGEAVRCLVRATSDTSRLEPLGVELVVGDLRDAESLLAACRGCRIVCHVAADYRFWWRDATEPYRINVDGTRNLLAAAGDAERIVYTSTVGTIRYPHDDTPSAETTPTTLDDMIGHYKRSKYLAEQVALERARAGQPIVVVQPSTPVGEMDARPTPTGKIIVDFLRGRMPAYVDTGFNLVDVRDVAAGHLLAAERGRVGERYILGCRNLSLRDCLWLLAEVAGRRPPRLRLPYAVAWLAGAGSELAARVRGGEPGIPLESVRMSRYRMYFDAAKARAELGLPQSPVDEALARAVAWFRANGYAP